MGYYGRPNCVSLDNHRCCRHPLMQRHRWLRWLGRPACVIDPAAYPLPRDGERTCRCQVERPRPVPPGNQNTIAIQL